jgi:hypothetical protein
MIDHELYPGYGTEPDFMISLALPIQGATGFPQMLFQARCI